MQSELGVHISEATQLRAREAQLLREVTILRENKRAIEEELHKLKTEHSVTDLQMKELQDQLEAEQYFSVNFCILLFTIKCIINIIYYIEYFTDFIQNPGC